MRSLLDDLRYAFRALRKNPVLTSVAILSLGIGIGANAAIFSLMDRVLFRALDVRDPRGLLLLRSAGGGPGRSTRRMATTSASRSRSTWRSRSKAAPSPRACWRDTPSAPASLRRPQTDATRGELVTGNYFDLLGVRPALGRLLTAEDSRTRGAQPVAVLSHGYWTRRFGGDPGILNQILVVNGTPLTVVGVAQAGLPFGRAPASPRRCSSRSPWRRADLRRAGARQPARLLAESLRPAASGRLPRAGLGGPRGNLAAHPGI